MRALRLDIETLAKDGAGEPEIRDYVRGFKDGLTTTGLNTAVQPFLQGATLGYGDEAKGAVQSLMTGNSRLFETARARGQLARAREDRPITSGATEIAGSMAPSVAGGLASRRLLGAVAVCWRTSAAGRLPAPLRAAFMAPGRK